MEDLSFVKLGRETPEVDCTVFFEDAHWKALVAYKTQDPIPPEKPPKLREAIHMVASLGGFFGQKELWRTRHLNLMAWITEIG